LGCSQSHGGAWKVAWAVRNELGDLTSVDRMKRASANDRHRALRAAHADELLLLTARRSIFQSLLKTALYDPLSWLQQPAVYRRNIFRSSLRGVLQTGAGLPLLFPKFEVGLGTRPARVQQSATSGVGTPL
jgi:hypothetical protein